MQSFLSSFSDSFLAALVAWPFAAALITLPILLVQYRKFNKIVRLRAIYTYLFVLYALGLATFTLYPMPDNAALFCQDYHLSPQLTPFSFINDIQSEGTRALLQVIMNVLFFVPLGIFARVFFQLRLRTVLLLGFTTSLFIETAQLTGAFHLYPCSYRLFDVDDLLINTLGALLGFALGALIPRQVIDKADKETIVSHPGLLRRLTTYAVDISILYLIIFVILIGYRLITKDYSTTPFETYGIFLMLALGQWLLPLIAKGKTLGGMITRTTLDNKVRSPVAKLIFYSVRLGVLILIVAQPVPFVGFLLGCFVVLYILVKKQPPYQRWL